MVVAADLATAEDAGELIRVDYDPLESVGTLEQAHARETLVYPDWGDNVLARVRFSSHAVDDTFKAAPYVFRNRYRIPRIAPMPLEPRGLPGLPSLDGITPWSSTQLPFIVRTVLAEALGLAEFDRAIRWIETALRPIRHKLTGRPALSHQGGSLVSLRAGRLIASEKRRNPWTRRGRRSIDAKRRPRILR